MTQIRFITTPTTSTIQKDSQTSFLTKFTGKADGSSKVSDFCLSYFRWMANENYSATELQKDTYLCQKTELTRSDIAIRVTTVALLAIALPLSAPLLLGAFVIGAMTRKAGHKTENHLSIKNAYIHFVKEKKNEEIESLDQKISRPKNIDKDLFQVAARHGNFDIFKALLPDQDIESLNDTLFSLRSTKDSNQHIEQIVTFSALKKCIEKDNIEAFRLILNKQKTQTNDQILQLIKNLKGDESNLFSQEVEKRNHKNETALPAASAKYSKSTSNQVAPKIASAENSSSSNNNVPTRRRQSIATKNTPAIPAKNKSIKLLDQKFTKTKQGFLKQISSFIVKLQKSSENNKDQHITHLKALHEKVRFNRVADVKNSDAQVHQLSKKYPLSKMYRDYPCLHQSRYLLLALEWITLREKNVQITETTVQKFRPSKRPFFNWPFK